MSDQQAERTRLTRAHAATYKAHWLMMRPNGTLWITAGRNTFDGLMAMEWMKSTPVVSLSQYQVETYRDLCILRRGF